MLRHSIPIQYHKIGSSKDFAQIVSGHTSLPCWAALGFLDRSFSVVGLFKLADSETTEVVGENGPIGAAPPAPTLTTGGTGMPGGSVDSFTFGVMLKEGWERSAGGRPMMGATPEIIGSGVYVGGGRVNGAEEAGGGGGGGDMIGVRGSCPDGRPGVTGFLRGLL